VEFDAERGASPVPFRVEHRCQFDHVLVEVRRYFWSGPLEQALEPLTESVNINMALTSRPPHTRVDHLANGMEPLSGEAGRLLVMIPGVSYRLAAPTGSLRSLHCAIGRTKLEELAGELIDWPSLGRSGVQLRPSSGLETHLRRIHEELVRNRLGREAMIRASVDMICVELARSFRRGDPARPDVHTGGLAAWRMRLILARIGAEEPSPTVIELADLCGLTERQLRRAFKAETGFTIGKFIDEAATERAHRLLTTTDLPIASIARELGFASGDSFAQSFRRLTGVAPSKIRQR
jgi:AraC family transcriptional regulator